MRPVSSTLFVVVCEPPAEHEAEFNRWYDEVHGPDALENGSFHKMRRYRAVGPGYCPAHYVNLWDGDYQSEAEAWACRARFPGSSAIAGMDATNRTAPSHNLCMTELDGQFQNQLTKSRHSLSIPAPHWRRCP